MKRRGIWVVLLGSAVTLSACMTPVPPVAVTRFHRIDSATALPPGSYAITDSTAMANPAAADAAGARVPPRADGVPTLADQSYAVAVGQQLDRLGFRPVPAGNVRDADYVVQFTVEHGIRPADGRGGSGVSVGAGGATGGYGSGVGIGVGIDLTRLLSGPPRDVITTRLSVRLTRRGDTLAVWEGRADSSARDRTPAAQPGIDAGKLADALFRDFPGRSGETITVP